VCVCVCWQRRRTDQSWAWFGAAASDGGSGV